MLELKEGHPTKKDSKIFSLGQASLAWAKAYAGWLFSFEQVGIAEVSVDENIELKKRVLPVLVPSQ
jgi:hypothetical protein